MSRLLFLAFCASVALTAPAAAAQPRAGSRIDTAPGAVQSVESEDEATARRVMRGFSGCVARARTRWAEGALALPFNSREQGDYVRSAIGGSNDCLAAAGAELRFRPPAMVGGMAEQLIEIRYARIDLAPIARLEDSDIEARGLRSRNGYEGLALCIVRRDAAAVRALVMTQPAGEAERAALGRIVPHLGPCLDQGQTLTLDAQAIRALLAPTLYRTLAALAPQGRN